MSSAKCMTSRGSPLSRISATCVRVSSRTRWLWTAVMANRLGMGALQSFGAIFHGEQHGQRGRQEIPLADAAHFFQVAVGEDRMRQLHGVAVQRRLVEDV